MKISPFNVYPKYQSQRQMFRGEILKSFELTDDIIEEFKFEQDGRVFNENYFVGFITGKENKSSEFNDFLNKDGRVSKAEYENIKANMPDLIVEAENFIDFQSDKDDDYISPKTAANFARTLKEEFDREEGDYRVLAIGTSPAMIAEGMEALGCDVVYFPITGLRDVQYKDYEKLLDDSEYPNIKTAFDYLASKGIKGEQDKKIILLDYHFYGTTLEYVNKLLHDRNGMDEENMRICSIIDTLNRSKNKYFEDEEIGCFSQQLKHGLMPSNTPHFDIDERHWIVGFDYIYSHQKNKKDVFKEFETHSTREARAFSLLMLNEL